MLLVRLFSLNNAVYIADQVLFKNKSYFCRATEQKLFIKLTYRILPHLEKCLMDNIKAHSSWLLGGQ